MYALLVILLSRAIAGLMPQATGGNLWGLDIWRFDSPLSVMLIALPFLLFIRAFQRMVSSWPAKSGTEGGLRHAPLILLLLAASVIVLHPVEHALYGDGSIYLSEIGRILADPSGSTSLVKPTSILTGYMVKWIVQLSSPESFFTPYRILGFAGIAVLIISLVAYRRGRRDIQSTLFDAALISGVGFGLLFGYVELYALQYAFLLMFFILLKEHASGTVKPYMPLSAFLASVLFGITSLIYLPLLALALVSGRGGKEKEQGPAGLLLIFIGACLVSVAGAYVLQESYLGSDRIPMLFRYANEPLFTAGHLIDVANALFLCTGGLLVFIPAFGAEILKPKPGDSPKMLLAAASTVSSFGYLLIADSTLGWARDWDLASIACLGIVFGVLLACDSSRRLGAPEKTFIMFALLIVNATAAAAWISHLTDARASADRVMNLAIRDMHKLEMNDTYHGFLNVWKYHLSTGRRDRAIEVNKRMIDLKSADPEVYRMFATELEHLEEKDSFRSNLAWLLDRVLTKAELIAGNDELRGIATKALLLARQKGGEDLFANYKIVFLNAFGGRWKEVKLVEAVENEQLALEERLNMALTGIDDDTKEPAFLDLVGRLCALNQRYGEAIEHYEKALMLDSLRYPAVYKNLLDAYLSAGDTLGAARTRMRAERNTGGEFRMK